MTRKRHDHPALAVGERRQHVGVGLERITGSESTIAAYTAIVTVVVNGSATPKVIGVRLPGSGALAISSSMSFCQKQSAKATRKRRDRDEDPRAKLVQVLDERDPVLEADRPNPGH